MKSKTGSLSSCLCAITALMLMLVPLFDPAEAGPFHRMLSHRVTDAEYSKALDRIITVSTTPKNQLHIFDPVKGEDIAVDLPLPPTCVSVAPDGLHAAVGHDAYVSYVDLAAPTRLKTIPVSTDVLDIVLAGNGYAYAFPRADQWENIRSINLESETEELGTDYLIYAGTKGKLHPSGKAMYGADNGLSPSDIQKYDISNGVAETLYDSPYHGDYAMCGDLWISEDGLRIFTACGNVFRSSEIRRKDMKYNGSLQDMKHIQWVDHSLPAGKVAVIPENTHYPSGVRDRGVWLYDYDCLGFLGKAGLPGIRVAGRSSRTHGRFVFFNQAGDRYYVVAQLDKNSPALLDFAVIDFPTAASLVPMTISATAGEGGKVTPAGDRSVPYGSSVTFTCSPDPFFRVADVLVDGVSVGRRTSYTFNAVRKPHTLEVLFELDPVHAIPKDYFGMDAGNTLEYVLSDNGQTSAWKAEVIKLDETTYLLQETGGGRTVKSWYQMLGRRLGLGKSVTPEGKIEFSKPLITLRRPIAENSHWISKTTATLNKQQVDVRLNATVSEKVIVHVPAGAFLAYPITYTMEVSGARAESTNTWTEFFAPYIGTIKAVKSEGKLMLSHLAVGKGAITTPPPIVTSVLPAVESSADEVIVMGFNFGASQPGSTVTIGEAQVGIQAWGNRKIKCILPPEGASGPVVVSTIGWKSNDDIEYLPTAAGEYDVSSAESMIGSDY